MALLGTLIHQVAGAIAGAATSSDLAFATHVHSLPATNPEMVHLQVLSLDTVGIINGPPLLFSPGGNASAMTVGYAIGSGASSPSIAYEATAFVFHSTVR